jgi:uncharacterized protein
VSASRSVGAPLAWNVAGLLSEDPGATRDYDIAGVTIDLGEDLRLADPIEGHIRLSRTNRGLLVDANLTASLQAECSRCLREIEVPIEVRIEEEALPSVDLHSGLPLPSERGEDDGPIGLTDHHELDLETPVREAIQLEEPIAALCREDCPGLCPVCGLPLDEGAHDHPDDEIDPRLEALKGFKPEEG